MNKIKAMREKKGITQVNFAKEMGVSQQCITKWETGKAMPQASRLPKLAKTLGCSIEELLEDDTKEAM